MKINLVPDYYFNTFDEVTPEFLASIGIRGIVLDVDNTLEPYENPKPSEKVLLWIKSLDSIGIKAAIVSNNNGKRIELFNQDLGLPAYYKAGKPFKKNVINAMCAMNTAKDETILMGDQVFTDVWAARNAGIRAILVPPINDKRDAFTKLKRLLERPIIKKYRKFKGEN